MITPSFGLTATERVLPRLALDFTTANLDSRVTITRSGNTATAINSSGVIASVNANLPRFDYNPTTLACRGLLIEEARTNLLLNSLIDGTSLATQIVVTTAAVHTLSFYGTGQIVLTGTSSATVVGAGAYPTRTTLTFTPTVGTLTLTVTGTVQFAQLEVGAFVTSFIPTAGATVTRNADLVTMTGTNFSSWFNASEGAFQCAFNSNAPAAASNKILFQVSDGSFSNFIWSYIQTNTGFKSEVYASGAPQASYFPGAYTQGTNAKTIASYKLNSFAAASNGANLSTDTSGTVPTVTSLNLGSQLGGGLYINGHLQKFNYWPQRIINAEVTAFSK